MYFVCILNPYKMVGTSPVAWAWFVTIALPRIVRLHNAIENETKLAQ